MKGRAILLQTKYFCGYFDNNNYKYIRENYFISKFNYLIICVGTCSYGNINYNFTYTWVA